MLREPPWLRLHTKGEMASEMGISEMTAPAAIADSILPDMDYLELQVQRRVGSRVRDLRIIFRAAGILLQGRASTYHAKQLAQHAAMEIIRQPILANDIEVC